MGFDAEVSAKYGKQESRCHIPATCADCGDYVPGVGVIVFRRSRQRIGRRRYVDILYQVRLCEGCYPLSREGKRNKRARA